MEKMARYEICITRMDSMCILYWFGWRISRRCTVWYTLPHTKMRRVLNVTYHLVCMWLLKGKIIIAEIIHIYKVVYGCGAASFFILCIRFGCYTINICINAYIDARTAWTARQQTNLYNIGMKTMDIIYTF